MNFDKIDASSQLVGRCKPHNVAMLSVFSDSMSLIKGFSNEVSLFLNPLGRYLKSPKYFKWKLAVYICPSVYVSKPWIISIFKQKNTLMYDLKKPQALIV